MLSQNKLTSVDDDVYQWAHSYKWSAAKWGNVFYAVRSLKDTYGKKSVSLHSCIVGKPFKGLIDHIDGDGLNNQRNNLRIVSFSENFRNSYKHRAGKKPGIFEYSPGKWQAHIWTGGKKKHLGTFYSEASAYATVLGAQHG